MNKATPIILALETATDACSVALTIGDLVLKTTEIVAKSHTRLIIPMMEALLAQAKLSFSALDALAVGRGLGSFTGVRIAVSLAQGLGFGLNCPIYPISTLQALAWQASLKCDDAQTHLIVPALDARMQEIYVAAYQYQQGVLLNAVEEKLCKPQNLNIDLDGNTSVVTIGSGWDVYGNLMVGQDVRHIANSYPDASDILAIAKLQWEAGVLGQKAEDVLPVYLRDDVAAKQA